MTANAFLVHWNKLLKNDANPGILLVMSAGLAMLLANSPLMGAYSAFLEFHVSIALGTFIIDKPLVLWINDGLMALFFFTVGLEIKREIFYGHLSSPNQIVLPIIASVAGIAVPALIYVGFNYHDPVAMNGWAIPSATDIAFALGVFILFGKYLPPSLKLFLLSVAIIDDIGAVIIIALFYSQELSTTSLLIAGIGLATLLLFNRLGLTIKTPFILVGIVVWAAVLKSGVHATLAGFAISWFIPIAQEKYQSMSYQIEHGLHPWVAFLVLPLFAFANAGVSFIGVHNEELITSVSLGVIAGLFIGKQLGIFTACWLAIKFKLCQLPKDANWRQLYSVSLLCGVGFTMSLFIGSLAFEEQGLAYLTQVKVGVLAGSLISAFAGALMIHLSLKPLNTPIGIGIYKKIKPMRSRINRMTIFMLLSLMLTLPFTAVGADYKSTVIDSCKAIQSGALTSEVNPCQLYINGFIDAALLNKTIAIKMNKKANQKNNRHIRRIFQTRVSQRMSSQLIEHQICIDGDDQKLISLTVAKALKLSALSSKPLGQVLLDTLIEVYPCKQ